MEQSPLTQEEARFIVMMGRTFLKQLDVSEVYLMGADMSEGRIQALSIMKKMNAFANPPPKVEKQGGV